MSIGRTQILSVHKFRRTARKLERKLTAELEAQPSGLDWLPWARGVRVRKAGPFQYVVEATAWQGH